MTYEQLADCSRHDVESVVMTADDMAEYNEYLDSLDEIDEFDQPIDFPDEDDAWDAVESEMDEVRRLAGIRCENRRTIEELLAARGVYVSIPLAFGDDV